MENFHDKKANAVLKKLFESKEKNKEIKIGFTLCNAKGFLDGYIIELFVSSHFLEKKEIFEINTNDFDLSEFIEKIDKFNGKLKKAKKEEIKNLEDKISELKIEVEE